MVNFNSKTVYGVSDFEFSSDRVNSGRMWGIPGQLESGWVTGSHNLKYYRLSPNIPPRYIIPGNALHLEIDYEGIRLRFVYYIGRALNMKNGSRRENASLNLLKRASSHHRDDLQRRVPLISHIRSGLCSQIFRLWFSDFTVAYLSKLPLLFIRYCPFPCTTLLTHRVVHHFKFILDSDRNRVPPTTFIGRSLIYDSQEV